MVKDISVVQMAEELLEREGKPLHYKVITNQLLGKCDLHGKTPHETVRSLIGTNNKFIRVAEGIYALSKWENFSVARYAKEIAFDVLKSKGKPMSLLDLGKEILAERKFIGGQKQVARNATSKDKRFFFDSDSELIYLTEWRKE